MKFLTFTALTALIASVSAGTSDVKLTTISGNKEVSGLGFSALHEGAGINYIRAAAGPTETYQYDEEKKTLFMQAGKFPYKFGIVDGIAQFGVNGFNEVEFKTDDLGRELLTVNGSPDGFYVCKNINDPYNFSKDNYFLVTDPSNKDDCAEVLVKKDNE